MKKHCIQFAAFGIICVGALLAFYPFLSNFLYENAQETVVMDYDDIVLRLENGAVAEEKCRAREYNDALKNGDVILTDPFDPEALRQKKMMNTIICLISGVMVLWGMSIFHLLIRD